MNNLTKKYEENNLKIKELTKKINLLEANSLDVKLVTIMIFAIIPWLILVFLNPTLVKFIPVNLIQPLTIVGGFLFMVIYHLPLLSINNFSNITIKLSTLELLSPLLLGSLIVSSYTYRKILDEKVIFKYFNKKLGKDALSDKINSKDKEDFNLELEKVIGISSLVKIELEKLKNDTKEIINEEKAKVKKLGTRYDLHK